MPAEISSAPRRLASAALVVIVAAFTLAPSALASDPRHDPMPYVRGGTAQPIVPESVVAQPSQSPAVIGLALARAFAETAVDRTATRRAPGQQLVPTVSPRRERPHGLAPLYASFAVLQALDVHSTLSAVHDGAVERNRVIAPLVNNPPAFVAFKAAAPAGTIVAVDRVAKHNRVAGYALMFALNSAYTFVVIHNYRVRP